MSIHLLSFFVKIKCYKSASNNPPELFLKNRKRLCLKNTKPQLCRFILLVLLLCFSSYSTAAKILWNQNETFVGRFAPEQKFEKEMTQFDSEGADDFEVPKATIWNISEVSIQHSTGGVASGVNINVYADDGGKPSSEPICAYENLVTFKFESGLTTKLTRDCSLSTGIYWFSHQTIQDFENNGQHFWNIQLESYGYPAMWKNPGNGYGSDCIEWGLLGDCAVGGALNPDFIFTLSGSSIDITKPHSVPSLNFFGILILILILIFLYFQNFFMKRKLISNN